MKIRLSRKDIKRTIRRAREAAQHNGREICGLLISNGHFVEILETKNASKVGGHSSFDPKQIQTIINAAKELNHRIVGTFHSHAAYLAKPGGSDIGGSLDDSLLMIIDCIGNEARLWRIKNGKAKSVKIETIEV